MRFSLKAVPGNFVWFFLVFFVVWEEICFPMGGHEEKVDALVRTIFQQRGNTTIRFVYTIEETAP